jgi:hypothetical protein
MPNLMKKCRQTAEVAGARSFPGNGGVDTVSIPVIDRSSQLNRLCYFRVRELSNECRQIKD